jgi:hypothetical protein
MLIAVFHIHSGLRVLLVVGLLAILVQGALAWTGKREYSHGDANLLKSVIAAMDVQLLLGIVLLFWTASTMGFPMMHVRHGIAMLLAAVTAHAAGRWTGLPSVQRGRRNTLTMLLVAALIAIGIAQLPQGWM